MTTTTTDPRTTDIPKFAVGDRVAFTHAYSAERIGNVLRRWWAGAWCYAVSDPIAGHGEWLLTESALSPAPSIWTLFDAQGYITRNGVEVQHYEDGTTRINASVHATDELTITENRIESHNGGWYLER